MAPEHPVRCRASKYLIDFEGRRVCLDGRQVDLSWRSFEALCAPVEAEGKTVERRVLMDRLWPGVSVEETCLTKVISELSGRGY